MTRNTGPGLGGGATNALAVNRGSSSGHADANYRRFRHCPRDGTEMELKLAIIQQTQIGRPKFPAQRLRRPRERNSARASAFDAEINPSLAVRQHSLHA